MRLLLSTLNAIEPRVATGVAAPVELATQVVSDNWPQFDATAVDATR